MRSFKNCFDNWLYVQTILSSKIHFLPYPAWGGGPFDQVSILAGKVQDGPQMVRMDEKQVILTKKV